jgi:hypothetical protein
MEAAALLVAAVLAGKPCEKGALAPDLVVEAESRGLSARSFQATVRDVRGELDRGRPVAACLRGRFVVLTAYDDRKSRFLLHDGKPLAYRRLMKRWQRSGRWALLLVPSEEKTL